MMGGVGEVVSSGGGGLWMGVRELQQVESEASKVLERGVKRGARRWNNENE